MSKSQLTLTPVETAACCSPLLREPLSTERAESVVPLLKALADPVRLRLVSIGVRVSWDFDTDQY